jgi:hypothetical protein
MLVVGMMSVMSAEAVACVDQPWETVMGSIGMSAGASKCPARSRGDAYVSIVAYAYFTNYLVLARFGLLRT